MIQPTHHRAAEGATRLYNMDFFRVHLMCCAGRVTSVGMWRIWVGGTSRHLAEIGVRSTTHATALHCKNDMLQVPKLLVLEWAGAWMSAPAEGPQERPRRSPRLAVGCPEEILMGPEATRRQSAASSRLNNHDNPTHRLSTASFRGQHLANCCRMVVESGSSHCLTP